MKNSERLASSLTAEQGTNKVLKMDEFKCEECGCEVSEDDCGLCDDCFDALNEECDEFGCLPGTFY